MDLRKLLLEDGGQKVLAMGKRWQNATPELKEDTVAWCIR
jgi:hypothetical protein